MPEAHPLHQFATRRVDTPPTQASWITVTSAFSQALRGFRKGRKYEPCRSFGILSWSEPSRVSRLR